MSYDAIVIGAGPAGSVCALLLARAGWRVAVVEKAEFPRRKVCGEFVSAPALSILERTGVGAIVDGAGPEIREVAIYAGERIVSRAMPPGRDAVAYGRALAREGLDRALLEAARHAGAEVWQPWRVRRYARAAERYVCDIERRLPSETARLEAPVVIAAHGSWDTGRIEPAMSRTPSGTDLFAFKARFSGAALPRDCMPLVAFPGGYGGMVTGEAGVVGFSCCITRAALDHCRAAMPRIGAGAAVLAHVHGACRGMREVLGDAVREGPWLAAGPLRPGFHASCANGAFAVGNAMAEAHPIVAEGISMAIQSSVLLCERLIAASQSCRDWSETARSYEAAYRRNFSARIAASGTFAQLAMRPAAAGLVAGLLERAPSLLALGARWAGKASPLIASA